MVGKKVKIIRDLIQNYIQSGIVDSIVKYMRVPEPLSTAIHLALNLDQISVVQMAVGKLGLYKWIAYCVYILFLA